MYNALPALQLLIDLCHIDLYTYIRKYIWMYKEILLLDPPVT